MTDHMNKDIRAVLDAAARAREARRLVNDEREKSDCSDAYYAAFDAHVKCEEEVGNRIAQLGFDDRDLLVELYVPLRRWAY